MIFFNVVDQDYLNNATALIARVLHVLIDADTMLMSRLMVLVKIAEALDKKNNS